MKKNPEYIGAFTKLWKATISFGISVRPSVRLEQLGSHWTNCHEILYLRIFRKSVEKIQVSLESDKNNRYLLVKNVCTCMMRPRRILLRM
jgi:hypothetical protein